MLEGAFSPLMVVPSRLRSFRKNLPGGRVAPQAEMLARDVGQRFELEIGPVIAAAAAHHDLVLGHGDRSCARRCLRIRYGECAAAAARSGAPAWRARFVALRGGSAPPMRRVAIRLVIDPAPNSAFAGSASSE